MYNTDWYWCKSNLQVSWGLYREKVEKLWGYRVGVVVPTLGVDFPGNPSTLLVGCLGDEGLAMTPVLTDQSLPGNLPFRGLMNARLY